MRIFDEVNDKTLKNIILCLTVDEAKDLRDSLNSLLRSKAQATHEHISDSTYNHEVTVAIYDRYNLQGFNPRIVKVIEQDK